MNLEKLKETLNDLIEDAKLDEVFDLLKKVCRWTNDMRLLKARYAGARAAYADGRIGFDEKSKIDAQVNMTLVVLVDELSEDDLIKAEVLPPPASSKRTLNDHHKYTCNRTDQYNPFFVLSGRAVRPRQHFFYLYGGTRQEHDGVFFRCVNCLKRIDEDHLKEVPALNYDVKSEVFDVSSDALEDMGDVLKLRLLNRLNYYPSDHSNEPLAGKALAPSLSRFKKNDQICFHFKLEQGAWDKHAIPTLLVDFIENFCLQGITEASPELFFFFSVVLDKDDEEIKTSINNALQTAKYVSTLDDWGKNCRGDLKMVKREHVERWFTVYEDFFKESPYTKEEVKKRHFGDPVPEEMYMDDVHFALGKVISAINPKH